MEKHPFRAPGEGSGMARPLNSCRRPRARSADSGAWTCLRPWRKEETRPPRPKGQTRESSLRRTWGNLGSSPVGLWRNLFGARLGNDRYAKSKRLPISRPKWRRLTWNCGNRTLQNGRRASFPDFSPATDMKHLEARMY